MKCNRCRRELKNPSPNGYGPKCAAAVLGVQASRVNTQRRPQPADERQVELFVEARP